MTVADFVLFLRRTWVFLVCALVVGAIVGAGYSAIQKPVYTATSSGFLQGSSEGGIVAQEKTDRITAYLALITSNAVVEKIAENPDLDVPAEEVRGSLSASLVGSSSMITVTATSASAEGAAALANGALEALAEVVQEVEEESSGGSVAALTVTPFENAVVPGAPSSPDWLRNILLGAAAGLALGLAYQLLRRMLDVKVRSAEDLTTAAGGAGLLARIPKMGRPKKDAEGLPELDTLGAESFRHLRTSLRFSSVDDEVGSIVITSPNQGEGKTTVAVWLARMIAESGVPTLIIDADLRRPAVARAFGVDGSVGLSSVLSGQVELNDALRTTKQNNLYVLPSGPVPPNPSEIIGSASMRKLVEKMSEEVFVIIDAPPVLPVTDAALASTIVDGVVFVARSGSTTKQEARHARNLLDQAKARVLGVVLNGVTKADGAEGYYYYSRKNRGYYMNAEQAATSETAAAKTGVDAGASQATSGRRARRGA